MKKASFLLPLLLLAVTSCATAFQQIATISSPQMRLADDGRFAYLGDGVEIDYNFWSENGQVCFVLTNKTDKDIYVDLSRSHLVVNGMTFDYYQNRTFSTQSSSTLVRSFGYGTSSTFAQAAGAGAAYGESYGYSAAAVAVGAAAGRSRTDSYSGRTTTSNTVNKSIEYIEREGVWVPALASRLFCEFSLLDAPFRKCGFARNPAKKEQATLSFNEKNSPYTFDNMLMLVVDGKDHRLVNSFYISNIANILRDQTYETDSAVDCNGAKTGETIHIYKFSAANRFFINYDFDSRLGAPTDRMKSGETESFGKKGNKASKRSRFSDGLYN